MIWTDELKEKFTELYNRGFNDLDIARVTGLGKTTIFNRRRKLGLPAHASASNPKLCRGGISNPLSVSIDEISRPVIKTYTDPSGKLVTVYDRGYAYGAEPKRNVGGV